MRHLNSILRVAAAATLVAGPGTAVHAQSITPPSVERTIRVGESFTINKSITLGAGGATTVDLFFLADNTGSMGSTINNAKSGAAAILDALPSSYRFGVGSYLGDPSEGVSPAVAYTQNTALTTDKTAVQTGINAWFASGGGDFPEANFFALQQVANTAGWRAEAQRLIVWFGDAPSHTATTTQAQAISALQGVSAKVVAFNNAGAGAGIDQGGQASAVVAGAGGELVNNFLSVTTPGFIEAVSNQISAATSVIDLFFGSTLLGSGLTLDFACTDVLGCDDVEAGQTRTFDMTVTGVTPGVYEFDVFARGVDAIESDRITVLGTTTTPEPVSMILLGTGLAGLGVVRQRRKNKDMA